MLAEFVICVGAGLIAKNSRPQFDEGRTAVTELGLSTRIRLCPTSWSSYGLPRKPLIERVELMCLGMPPDWQRNCHSVACGLIAVVNGPALRSPSGQIFEERMAKTCRKRPGNLTRNTDG
jgi:hypothetical protein